MKAELKALARESFMDELERMKQIHPLAAKVNNNSYDVYENERQQNLEMEVNRLNQMVEDMRYSGQPGGSQMQVEWSNPITQAQALPQMSPSKLIGGGSPGGGLTSWNNSLVGNGGFGGAPMMATNGGRFDEGQMFNGSRFESMNATPYANNNNRFNSPFDGGNHSKTLNNTNNNFNHQFSQQSNQVNNNMFILSTAPISGFNKLLNQEENLPQLSLVEQAHRFAEMQALFQLPAHLPPNDPFHLTQQQFERDQQAERQRRSEFEKQQKQKLQSSIEEHKGRLEKSRNTPRRFPMDSKPSMQSPRAKLQSRTQQPTPLQEPSFDTLVSMPVVAVDGVPPSSAMQTTQHPLNGTSVDSLLTNSVAPGSTLEGPAAPAAGSPNAANNPATGSPASPKRPKTITLDEFEQKTDKINEDLKKLVREVVHQEMLADGHAQHYTKRFQNKLLATKQETLVSKIEKSVGDKIAQLQKELEDLKEQKVKGKKKKMGLRDSGDNFDEGL